MEFLPFKPGLVGGHCIGVDPFYLTYKAQSVGYYPEIILAGRRLNDGMPAYIAREIIKLMARQGFHIKGSKILVMGLAFKENCPDLRNTRVADLISEFESYGIYVDCYDPWVDAIEAEREYNIKMLETPEQNNYEVVTIAVAHDEFKRMGIEAIRSLGKSEHILYDIKNTFPLSSVDARL